MIAGMLNRDSVTDTADIERPTAEPIARHGNERIAQTCAKNADPVPPEPKRED